MLLGLRKVKLVLSHFLSVKWSAFQTFWEPYLIFSYFSGFFLQTCTFCKPDLYVLHLSYALQFSHITVHKNCLYLKVFSIFSTGLLKKVNFNCLLLFFCWCYTRYFWHIQKLMLYLYLRASNVIYGELNLSYPFFF